jgi:serine/threonine-protein kinase
MPAPVPRAVEPGIVAAGYRIVRMLGAGGSGAVYLTEPAAALKIAGSDIMGNRRFAEQFRRAAELATSLDHPNVVPVQDYGELDDGRLWVAMPYVPGIDADAALRAGQMPSARAVRIIAEIAAALDYLHGRGLLHGDVKPSNFLVSEGLPGSERVLLADSGLLRIVGDVGRPPGATAENTVLISAAYAAPEALLGHPADPRSDIYSLGCSLFRLLTGKPPFFDAGAKPATVQAQLHRDPPRVTDVAPWLPPAIGDVVSTAMAKDPAARYSTAAELALTAQSAISP